EDLIRAGVVDDLDIVEEEDGDVLAGLFAPGSTLRRGDLPWRRRGDREVDKQDRGDHFSDRTAPHASPTHRVQQPGRPQPLPAPQSRDAGPGCCNGWFGGSAGQPQRILFQARLWPLTSVSEPAALLNSAGRFFPASSKQTLS